ncbi:MAG: glycosyltransferase family 2 protein [candidate division KSB1 bacterium]|nr:glycosyltransferase family 2 protein [candidate division KSB1 bacterium]MDZ7368472.1 glycosyltransferase family 2 protein [candidate division KSB1 bacterium]MDZ7406198.1 glycosyltransferase family 2 protein [candidate division KSB1 bacterium]
MNPETPIEKSPPSLRPAEHRNRRRRRSRRKSGQAAQSAAAPDHNTRPPATTTTDNTDGHLNVKAKSTPTAAARPQPNSLPRSSATPTEPLALSVVIPLVNEAASLTELHGNLTEVLNRLRVQAEMIFVDDGSTDDSFEILQRLQKRDRRVRVIQFRRNYGKSAALAAGFSRAKGRYIVTMDADLQDDPEEIPHLLNELRRGCDLVSGWKKRRHDKLSKRLASKVFNTVTSFLTGLKLHDINCGLKAYRREVTDSIHVYGQLHRYLPVLAFKEGFRVSETEVRHHPRKYGKSKFGLSRYTSGFFDLLTVLFLTRYTRRPLHLFGIGGLTSFLLGFGISAYLTYERLFNHRYLTNRPILWLGLLLIIVGIQLISFGLLGEMLAATQNHAPNYGIKAELGFEKR